MQAEEARLHLDHEEIERDLERFNRDADYFYQHQDELLRQYPERWVAIYHQEVVGTAKDPKRLVKQLQRKGIRPGRVFREYLTDQEELLIL